MIAAIVLPPALAAIVALCLAIAPITSTISALAGATSATHAVIADIKADIAKHKAHKKKPASNAGR